MNLILAWFHIHWIASLWLALGLLVAASMAGSERIRWAWYAWWVMPLPVMLGFSLGVVTFDWRDGMELAFFTWIAGWLLLGWLVRRSVAVVPGLMAFWELVGIGFVLMAAADPFRAVPRERGQWLFKQSIIALASVSLAVGAAWMTRRRSEWVGQLFGPAGVISALALFAVTLLLAFTNLANKIGDPPPRITAAGPWAFAVLSFLLGVAIVAGRTLETLSVPASILQWLYKWRWSLFMALFPAIGLLISQDLSPALILLLVLAATFWMLQQLRATAVLVLLGALGLWISYTIGKPERLVERIHLMRLPWEGETSQIADTLWAVARGGWFGQGLTRYLVISSDGTRIASEAIVNPERYRHAVILAKTDGIWAFTAETSGVLGVVAILGLAAVVAYWLWQEARNAVNWRTRAWFVAVWTTWVLCFLFTLAWNVRCAPIMGLAVPLLSAGFFNTALWFIIFIISFVAALSRIENPNLHSTTRMVLPRRFTGVITAGLYAIFVLYATFVVVSLIRYGVLQRETILQGVFRDRWSEAYCRNAILQGWVVAQNGQPTIRESQLPTDPKHREDIKNRLRRWITKGVIRVDSEGELYCEPSAFNRSEPSGIGSLLSKAGGEL